MTQAIDKYLDEVKRLRESATPGPWEEHGSWYIEKPSGVRLAEAYDARDIRFISSMPETSERLEKALRCAVEAIEEHHDIWKHREPSPGYCAGECSRLCKALAEIKKIVSEE